MLGQRKVPLYGSKMPASSRLYSCCGTPSIIVDHLKGSKSRRVLCSRQADLPEHLGESWVGPQRVQPRLPLRVDKKCRALRDCLSNSANA
jgi:hypothetical protein